ncbi:hypothetical protein LTR08_005539 [Meristemomyces frigidus]|nr:hypothetical protein LTR08_005539 [Meristemomyces frigidus]
MASTTDARNTRLFESGRYSDMTVVCGERSWKLHKNIVLEQSKTFENMFEGAFQEARENRVDLSHDDESAVAAMPYYFYHSDYDEQKVYIIADRYFIDALSKLALDKFKVAVLAAWYKDEFADAVAEIYASTLSKDNAFRRTIVAISKARARQLFHEREKRDKFMTVACEIPAFMLELVQVMACRPLLRPLGAASLETNDGDYWHRHLEVPLDLEEPEERSYRCPDCRTEFKQRLWDGEDHYHLCATTPQRTSFQCSGRQWLQYLVT